MNTELLDIQRRVREIRITREIWDSVLSQAFVFKMVQQGFPMEGICYRVIWKDTEDSDWRVGLTQPAEVPFTFLELDNDDKILLGSGRKDENSSESSGREQTVCNSTRFLKTFV